MQAIAAALGGRLRDIRPEAPRIVRGSRLYEATAKNLLRMTIECWAASSHATESRTSTSRAPGRLAVRKGAGDVVVGSIAAFGFCPAPGSSPRPPT